MRPLREVRCRGRRSVTCALAAASLIAVGAAPTAHAADPLPATEIAQDVTLAEAAQANVLQLKAKGGFGGDVVAVDLDGARIPGKPVTVRVRLEFWGADAAGNPWPPDRGAAIAAAIEGRLSGLSGSDGTPVTIDVIPSVRGAGAPPTPGFHQIELQDVPSNSIPNTVNDDASGPSGVRTGEWSSNAQPITYAHETVHLLGFHDRYQALQPDLLVDGKRHPLPKFTGDKSNRAQLDAWFEKVLKAEAALEKQLGKPGELVPGVPAGHEDDILANTHNPNATILKSDLDALIARAGVHLSAKPGDLIASKDGSQQNLGVGAPLELFAPRGGRAHADGLYAYCIDLKRHVPAAGLGFDVLGPAKDLGSPQLAALQLVLEEIARRQEPSSPLAPGGAQDAVWAVTDGSAPSSSGQAVLDAAGVAFDASAFSQTPHYDNPNAAAPGTAAVTLTGAVLATIPADRTPPPAEPIGGSDAAAQATGRLIGARVVAHRSRRTLRVRIAVDGPQQQITIGLRGGSRGKVTRLGVVAVEGGLAESTVKLARKLPRGRSRLVLRSDAGWTRTLSVRLGGSKRR